MEISALLINLNFMRSAFVYRKTLSCLVMAKIVSPALKYVDKTAIALFFCLLKNLSAKESLTNKVSFDYARNFFSICRKLK